MNPLYIGIAAILGIGAIAYAKSASGNSGQQVAGETTYPIFTSSGYNTVGGTAGAGADYAISAMPISGYAGIDSITSGALSSVGLSTPIDNAQNTGSGSATVNSGVNTPAPVVGTSSGDAAITALSDIYAKQSDLFAQMLDAQRHSDDLLNANLKLQTTASLAQGFMDANKQAAKSLGLQITPTSEGGYNLYAITDAKQAADVLAPQSALGQAQQFNELSRQSNKLTGMSETALAAMQTFDSRSTPAASAVLTKKEAASKAKADKAAAKAAAKAATAQAKAQAKADKAAKKASKK